MIPFLLLLAFNGDAQCWPSKQLNRSNLSKLQLAWPFPVPQTTGRFGLRPLVVDGSMYVLGPKNAIVALDAITGRQFWSQPTGGRPTARGTDSKQ